MFVVFWTYQDARGVMTDAYEMHAHRAAADAPCNQLKDRQDVYAYGMGPVLRASEPHWSEGEAA